MVSITEIIVTHICRNNVSLNNTVALLQLNMQLLCELIYLNEIHNCVFYNVNYILGIILT